MAQLILAETFVIRSYDKSDLIGRVCACAVADTCGLIIQSFAEFLHCQ